MANDGAGGAGGAGGNGGGDGGNGGGGGSGFSLDMPFDVNAVAEEHRPLFQNRNVGKIGDVVNWAIDAEARAMAGSKIAPDAKLDLSQFSTDYQKTLGAKKLETVQALADSVINAEKLIGGLGGKPLLAPEPGKMVEFFGKNAETFGVPKTPADYQWNAPKLPDGMEFDKALDAEFRDFAHKRALPGEMYQDFADFGANLVVKMQQSAIAKVQEESAQLEATLKTDWGQDFAKNRETAQFAARQLGLDGAIVDALSRETGNAATLKILHAVGAKMEGASLITGDGRTVATAKAEANAEMERKSADANWTKALHDATHPGHAAAVAENERLMKIIHG